MTAITIASDFGPKISLTVRWPDAPIRRDSFLNPQNNMLSIINCFCYFNAGICLKKILRGYRKYNNPLPNCSVTKLAKTVPSQDVSFIQRMQIYVCVWCMYVFFYSNEFIMYYTCCCTSFSPFLNQLYKGMITL